MLLPMRTMKNLGVEILFVTNAAGGLNSDFNLADVMIMSDHICLPGLAGKHPLVRDVGVLVGAIRQIACM